MAVEPTRFPLREEDVRAVARSRLSELRHLLEMAEERVEESSLFQCEADFQVMAALCETAAAQLLRVLEATGAIQQAGQRQRDLRPEAEETGS